VFFLSTRTPRAAIAAHGVASGLVSFARGCDAHFPDETRHDDAWHRRVDSWTAERNEQAEPAKPPWMAAEAEAILVYVDLHGCRFSADGVDASEAREARVLSEAEGRSREDGDEAMGRRIVPRTNPSR